MDEISSDELYKGLLAYGMFSEKLPPIFTSESFYKYCLTSTETFGKKSYDYVSFDSMRNINIPRQMGIPTPMAYHNLCACLKLYWENIRKHFHIYTDHQTYKVSRSHIRKIKNSNSLFKMNYKKWQIDASPQDALLLGNRYVVHADISTCFPSIYTHSLCWAFVGKDEAKKNRQGNWYNEIDKLCRYLRYGETHGLMIGPYASNLLSECILVVIDKMLWDKGWKYIRTIDDYICYVPSEGNAKKFIVDLKNELQKFDLFINFKKLSIEPLPIGAVDRWVRKLNSFNLLTSYGKVDYTIARSYFDLAIELMEQNNNNTAILNYAIKVLEKQKLTDNAKKYYINECMHLSIIYPYLLPLLDSRVFTPYKASKEQIKEFADIVYNESCSCFNYEGVCYAIYYSLKYDFCLEKISYTKILEMNSCLTRLFGMLYYKRLKDKEAIKAFKDDAKQLLKTDMDMDRYWIYIYETLSYGNLKDDWKKIKKAGISFLKTEFQY